jgi:drug/metabolite transporter (DMT)-like permease
MRKLNLPILAVIVANMIWGAASPIFKYSLQNIPPFSLAFLRFLIASLILYPLVHKKLSYSDLKSPWRWAFAICSVPINITFFFLALERTASINAPIIGSTGPVMILLFSAMFLHEKIRPWAIVGTILSLLGILVIIFGPILDHGLSSEILGNVFLIIATLGAVAQAIIGRKYITPANVNGATFWSFFIGTLTFVPFMLAEYWANPGWMANLDSRGWTGIIFGGLFSSFVAYTIYDWALCKLPAYRVSIFAYIDPVVAIAIAVPLLGEKLTPPFLLGSFLVFFGILIAEHRIHYHPIHKLFNSPNPNSNEHQ